MSGHGRRDAGAAVRSIGRGYILARLSQPKSAVRSCQRESGPSGIAAKGPIAPSGAPGPIPRPGGHASPEFPTLSPAPRTNLRFWGRSRSPEPPAGLVLPRPRSAASAPRNRALPGRFSSARATRRLVDTLRRGAPDPMLGKLLGDTYRITRVVGEGGMGRVYERVTFA